MDIHDRLCWFKQGVVGFFYPARCIGCGRGGVFLCSACRQSLPGLVQPLCEKCSKPLSAGGSCSNCQRWQLEIDGISSPFCFEGMIRQAIIQLKYHHFKALAPSLAQLLVDYLKSKPLSADVIVPVPLHRRRLKRRGYNQSDLLARELGKGMNIPVVDDCLRRLRDTPSQTKSAAERRHANMQEAFACESGRLWQKHVILVDDVSTTGATLNSCAIALKESGVASVWGLTLARET